MKKLKALQFLVYLVFALLIVHDVLPGFTRGLIDGFTDGRNEANGQPSSSQLLPATLYGDVITQKNSTLKIDNNYTLQNIYLDTDVRLSTDAQANKSLTVISTILTSGIAIVFILIAININKTVVSIVNGQAFGEKCIRYIRRIGSYLLIYAIADVILQRINIAILRDVIHGSLHVYNTTSFNFQVIICAILIFIAAEAFKYGAQLKAEQELTI